MRAVAAIGGRHVVVIDDILRCSPGQINARQKDERSILTASRRPMFPLKSKVRSSQLITEFHTSDRRLLR